jgi:hypothetical protein
METLQRTANRGSISTGYEIENSLKLEADNSEQVRATGTTDSGNRKTWTFSTWVKRTEIDMSGAFGVNALFYAASSGIGFMNTDELRIVLYTDGGLAGSFTLSQLFRDTSAWYHIVLTVDSTEATSTNRVKLWLNGEQVTDFSTETYPNLNDEFQFGKAQSAAPIRIGNAYWGTSPLSAYIAETHYLNGTAKQASDFGEYDADSGIWIPKEYTDGGYGDIGFYYKYDNASSLGEDSSGEGHDASSLSNITAADQATDTPTNNFCIMNVLNGTNSDITTSQGGTQVNNTGSSICSMNASMGVSNGKWYWECRFANDPGFTNAVFVGIAASNDPYVPHNSNNYLGQQTGYGSIGWYFVNGAVYNGTGTWTGPGYGNIIMFALDMDNLKLYFGKEGTWQNSSNPETNTNGIDIATSFTSLSGGTDIILPAISVAGGDKMDSMNFGGFANYTQSSAASDSNGYGTFEYAPPSGYYALCTKNLAEYG